MGKKVLLLDLDPQCNLTICGMKEEQLHAIWEGEEPFIDDYESAWKSDELVEKVLESPRSIHFLLKATEEGVNELENYPNPIKLYDNLDLIPGRLSIHQYENKIAERWSSVYQGDNLGIRTIRDTYYTSVHYVIKPNNELSNITCEIQVRTLFEEIWGEIDHTINYPHPTEIIACKEQLRVLAKLVSTGTRLADSIFRTYNDVSEK
ncbi:MAG: hypothetical protein ACLVGF_12035 [Eubacterium sp.]